MSDEWSTPQELFDELDNEFCFDIDVCASDWNRKHNCYYTETDNALGKNWFGTVWMNPPYSGNELERWIRKAYEESQKGVTIVSLIPARTETQWFHECCLNCEIRFVRGRIHFKDKNGKSGRPRLGNMILIFRQNNTGKIGKPLKYIGGK